MHIFLTGGTETIDSSIFDVIVNGATAVLGLFSIFPLNIFLAAGLIGTIVGVIKQLRHSS
jgi:hypothetical protein